MSRVKSVKSLQLNCSSKERIRQTTCCFCVLLWLFYWSGTALRIRSDTHIRVSHFAKVWMQNTTVPCPPPKLVLRPLDTMSHRLNPRKANPTTKPPLIKLCVLFPFKWLSSDCDRATVNKCEHAFPSLHFAKGSSQNSALLSLCCCGFLTHECDSNEQVIAVSGMKFTRSFNVC